MENSLADLGENSTWHACVLFSLIVADVLASLDLTMDENKENQTPDGVQQQGEMDWVQQHYNFDQEREELELQQALAQSLQEHVSSLSTELWKIGLKRPHHQFWLNQRAQVAQVN